PMERTHLVAAIYGRDANGANLMELKRVAQYVTPGAEVVPVSREIKTAHPERAASVNASGHRVGHLYELHPGLLDRGRAAILDVDLDALQSAPAQRQAYRPLRRFPTSAFDLSIVAATHEPVA